MSPLALLVRRGLRRHWIGWVLVALLSAITLSVAGGALSVARQTLDAYPRLLDSVHAADLTVGIGFPENPDQPGTILPADLANVPGIADVRVVRNTISLPLDADGRFDMTLDAPIVVAVQGTPPYPLVRGRLPAVDSADEVAISAGAVRALGVDVGDRIRYAVATQAEAEEMGASGADHGGTAVNPVVVGIIGPDWLDGAIDAPTRRSMILAGAAFLRAHPGVGTYQVARIWVRPDTTVSSVLRLLEERFGSDLDVTTRSKSEATVRRAVSPEAYAVLGLGIAAALAGLIVTALTIARQLNDSSDELTFLALGATRRQRLAQRWAQALIAIAAGTVLGLAGSMTVAVVVGPAGIAHTFDRPGIRPSDLLVALGAAFAVSLALAAFAAGSSWRNSRVVRRPLTPAPAPAWVRTVVGATPTDVRTGAALAGRGTGAHRAMRAAVFGAAVSVAVGVAVITFARSLDALVSTPSLYGSNYDLAAWDGYGATPDDVITSALRRDPKVAGISRAAGSIGTVNGREAGLVGFEDFSIGPRLTNGVFPDTADEVFLGRRLARRLGAGIGDEVTIGVGDKRQSYSVVGVGVMPDTTGDGAAFTLDGIHRVAADATVGFQYVRLRPNADVALVVQRYGAAIQCPSNCDFVAPSPPSDVAYLDRVGDLPRWAVGVVMIMGMAMSIQALVIVGRRSRRSVAILRSIGATRRQVTRYLLLQTMLIVVVAVTLGVVGGLLLGRFAWGLFADGLGVVPRAATSPVAISVSLMVLAVITTAAAAVPAWRTANRPVAPELRAD